MHAFIITGVTQDARRAWTLDKLREWTVAEIDSVFLEPEGQHVGIAEVRRLEKRLMLKPFGADFSVGIVQNAELMTTEAQNALLKSLEEPPPHARFILETGLPEALLPTVLSRCEIVQLKPTVKSGSFSPEKIQEIEILLGKSPGDRLLGSDIFGSTREEARDVFRNLLEYYHRELLYITGSTIADEPARRKKLLTKIKLADKIIRAIDANIAYRHAVDLFLIYAGNPINT